jgi:dynein heavy chain 2, cytosolic
MQQAGIEGQQMIILLEDHQLIDSGFLELVNSLLASGEIPGLYNPEELEPLLAPIREDCLQENFRGTVFQYFAKSILRNLILYFYLTIIRSDYLSCSSAFYYFCRD